MKHLKQLWRILRRILTIKKTCTTPKNRVYPFANDSANLQRIEYRCNTFSADLDIRVILKFSTLEIKMYVLVFFIGTDEERGILAWRKNLIVRSDGVDPNQSIKIYEYPYVTEYFRRVKCCTYIPVSPVFNKEITANCSCCRSNKNQNSTTKTGYENQAATDDVEIEVTLSKEEEVKL